MIKKKILVVDDELNFLNSIKRSFKISKIFNQIDLNCVTSVDDAVKFLNINRTEIVLVDMYMPNKNGSELIDVLLKMDIKPYIIIITGNNSLSEAVSFLKRGVFDYLAKPLNMDELILKISHILSIIDKERQIEVLKEEVHLLKPRDNFITTSQNMNQVLKTISSAQNSDFPILLLGESGTGKEVVADKIHFGSSRSENPYIKINSAGIVSTLVESEMFGHEKGAYTGALKDKPGKFELANSGTLFLDEIGDMDISLQVKLLRVLQDGTFEHVGGTRSIQTDVRIIAATNKDLSKLILEEKFREDLFYRLNIITIELPPLRERREDIPPLSHHFLNNFNTTYKKNVSIDNKVFKLLDSWSFPGNIRELENIIARCFAMCSKDVITSEDLPDYITTKSDINKTLIDTLNLEDNISHLERKLIETSLKSNRYNKSEAANDLGISRRQLYYKMKKHGLK